MRATAARRTDLVGPYRAHQEQILTAPEAELRDGNVTEAPSVHVLRQAAAEKRARSRYSPRVVEDIGLMMRISQRLDAQSRYLKGDIHFNADTPFVVHVYRESTMNRYRASPTTVHFDSTGSVTRKVGTREPCYYALVAGGTEESWSYPVAHMLSERHNVPTIAHFLLQLAYDYRVANGGTATLQPPRVVTDCSWALLHAATLAFNHVSLPVYLDACWKGTPPATLVSLCTAHFSHQLSSAITIRLGRKKKKERQQLMWLFGRMQQVTTVDDLDRLFQCVCQLLLSKEVPNLSIKIREEDETEDEIEEDGKPPQDADVKWQSYRRSTEAGRHFEAVKQNVEKGLAQDSPQQDEDIHNGSFCPALMEYVLSSVMPLAPLWTQLTTDGPVSNACVESWHKTVKRQILMGKKRLPPGELIELLLQDAAAREKESIIPPKKNRKKRRTEEGPEDAEERWRRKERRQKTGYVGKIRAPSSVGEDDAQTRARTELQPGAEESPDKQHDDASGRLSSAIDVDTLPSPAESAEPKTLMVGNVSINIHDVDSLVSKAGVWATEREAWLTGSVIGGFLLTAAGASPSTVSVFEPSSALATMSRLNVSRQLTEHLQGRFGVHHSDAWLIPFNMTSYGGMEHWVLFIVVHRAKSLVFLDSLGSRQPPKQALSDVIGLVNAGRRPGSWAKWTLIIPEETLRQSDGRSCGIFVCLYGEALCSGHVPEVGDSEEALQTTLDDTYRRLIQRRLREVRIYDKMLLSKTGKAYVAFIKLFRRAVFVFRAKASPSTFKTSNLC